MQLPSSQPTRKLEDIAQYAGLAMEARVGYCHCETYIEPWALSVRLNHIPHPYF
jgi:hypothetical protein